MNQKNSESKKKKRKKQIRLFFLNRKQTWVQKISHFIPVLMVLLSFYLYKFKDYPLYDQTVFFGGILPICGILGFIYLFVYGFIDPTQLTDNVKANRVFAPFVFLGVFYYSNSILKLPFFGQLYPYWGSLGYSVLFVSIYLYSSVYFQPDLDVYGARPGMTHFPVGRWISAFRVGRFIKWLLQPVTKAWYKLWSPYAFLFTHRGITHWPVFSTLFRVGYLLLIFLIIKNVLLMIGLNYIILNKIINYFKLFYPFHPDFLGKNWILFCLPIYLCDFVHIAVDYIDAVKRGIPYCSPRIPRGFFASIWADFKNKI